MRHSRHRRPAPLAATFLTVALLLGACGQKGSLYLPDEPADEDEQTEER